MSATTEVTQPTATVGLAERVRAWVSPLNLHWAGVGLLALVNLYLVAQMGLLWKSASSHNADAMAEQRIVRRTAEVAAEPLRGVDTKLAQATTDADTFYQRRLPSSYSEVAGELGALTKEQRVRLIRVSYAPSPVLPGTAGELTEVRMDASLSGDYRPLVQFMNSLERDKTFFLITGVTLTGQQTGVVNLRLRLTTYLRGKAIGSAPEMTATPAAAAIAANGGTGR
jgi:type IV pilus assembly protein PilO